MALGDRQRGQHIFRTAFVATRFIIVSDPQLLGFLVIVSQVSQHANSMEPWRSVRAEALVEERGRHGGRRPVPDVRLTLRSVDNSDNTRFFREEFVPGPKQAAFHYTRKGLGLRAVDRCSGAYLKSDGCEVGVECKGGVDLEQ